jgi:hypothetical protein
MSLLVLMHFCLQKSISKNNNNNNIVTEKFNMDSVAIFQ